MKSLVRHAWLLALLLSLFVVAPVPAQTGAPAAYSQQDLDRLLAPIALYPDPLLSQILIASTRPMEVVEASRWLRANPGLSGEDAVRAAAQSGWDPSVQSLAAFPQILAMMEEHFEWMQSLGQAFLSQQPYVMQTVQALRQRAFDAGKLRNSEQINVERQGPRILIEFARPQLVSLPYYDPLLVYGTWWHPLPPVRWRPWPGYAGRHGGFYWGRPVQVAPQRFAQVFVARGDWPRRHAVVIDTARVERPVPAPRVGSSEARPIQREEVRRDSTRDWPSMPVIAAPRFEHQFAHRFEPRIVQPGPREVRIERNPARPEFRHHGPRAGERREQHVESRPQVYASAGAAVPPRPEVRGHARGPDRAHAHGYGRGGERRRP